MAIISPPARNFLNSAFVNVESLRNIEGERQTHCGAEFVMVIAYDHHYCGSHVVKAY